MLKKKKWRMADYGWRRSERLKVAVIQWDSESVVRFVKSQRSDD